MNFYSSDSYKLSDVQKLIERYKVVRETALLKEIKDKLSLYIRNYPSFAFHIKDEDVLSDFFIVAFSKIEYMIDHYDSNKNILFKTYLSHSLKNIWINFCLQEKKKVKTINNNFLIEKSSLVDEDDSFFIKLEKINHIFSLEEDEFKYLIIKLYYYNFFNEQDFIRLSKFTKKTYGDCLFLYKNLLKEIDQKAVRKNHFFEVLKKIQINIIRLSNDEIKNGKKDKLREKYEKHFKLYQRAKNFPSYRVISYFFDCEAMEVSNVINYFKIKIKKLDNINKYLE